MHFPKYFCLGNEGMAQHHVSKGACAMQLD